MEKRSRPELFSLACFYLVELPGIELGTEIALNCGNADLGYAKRREST